MTDKKNAPAEPRYPNHPWRNRQHAVRRCKTDGCNRAAAWGMELCTTCNGLIVASDTAADLNTTRVRLPKRPSKRGWL